VTLRLPESLYENIKGLAKRRHISINSLAQQELERLAEAELAARMRAGYEALSSDEADAEVFFAAQSEVLAHGE
jgi:hypothetical protein